MFFTDYDQFRYRNERHLPACIEALDVAGRKVLEIGLGEGADAERLIRQGARWSGVDLTAESVDQGPDPADAARACRTRS